MMRLLFRWLVTTLAILAASQVIPGIGIPDFRTAVAAAIVLSLLNLLLKPILVVLTLPLTLFSFGFFLLVINAGLFMLAGRLVDGMHVASFWSALGASLFVSIVTWLSNLSVRQAEGGRMTVVLNQTQRSNPPPTREVRDLNEPPR